MVKQRALGTFIQSGWNVYDIGAHVGFYSLLFSKLVGPAGAVWAFEPCAANVVHLADHLRLNEIRNVTVIQAAVGAGGGLTGFTTRAPSSSQNRVDPTCRELLLPQVALDQLELPAPNLIKMDVEGAESQVLQGASRLLASSRPIIFIALHSEGERQNCAALLRRACYKLYDLFGSQSDWIQSDEIYAVPEEIALASLPQECDGVSG
ncbi:MAG TPA: FkbM family methyltransferase [Candidatus Binataceae bacterium]|nr:FkbM family methyltransferase [Candidatus Binataceae bacterium]